MQTTIFSLPTLEKTQIFGIALGRRASAGDILCLDGDLGTGKTTLTQAIARGLAVPDEYYVTSPSFTIFHEYPGKIPLYHMDLYRLSGSDDFLEMGLDELFYMSGLTVIEWAEKAEDVLPQDRLSIFLEIAGPRERRAHCSTLDPEWQRKIEEIANEIH